MTTQFSLFPSVAEATEAGVSWCTEVKLTSVRQCVVRDLEKKYEDASSLAAMARQLYEAAAWYDPDKEAMVVIILDTRMRVKAFNLVSLGTLTGTLCAPREFYRPAVVAAAASVVAVHNHPSGEPQPSTADIQLTRQLKSAGEVMGIPLTDHLILGDPSRDPLGTGFYSFRANGLV